VTLSAKKPLSGAYPVSLTTLGDHIRKRRLDLKLLQKDVAVMLAVDTMTVNNWERNRCHPRLYLFPRIVQLFGYNHSPTIENPSIIETIKGYRLIHGLSQKKMAKLLSIDPTTLARWEDGRSRPSLMMKKQLDGFFSGFADRP